MGFTSRRRPAADPACSRCRPAPTPPPRGRRMQLTTGAKPGVTAYPPVILICCKPDQGTRVPPMAHACTTLLRRLPAALAPRQLVSGGCAVAHRLQPWHRQQQRQLSGGRAAAAAGSDQEASSSGQPKDSHLFQSILSGILAPYWGAWGTRRLGRAGSMLVQLICCVPVCSAAGRSRLYNLPSLLCFTPLLFTPRREHANGRVCGQLSGAAVPRRLHRL